MIGAFGDLAPTRQLLSRLSRHAGVPLGRADLSAASISATTIDNPRQVALYIACKLYTLSITLPAAAQPAPAAPSALCVYFLSSGGLLRRRDADNPPLRVISAPSTAVESQERLPLPQEREI